MLLHSKSDLEPTTLRVRVGDTDNTTPFQAKLLGIELVVANAKAFAPQHTDLFCFFNNNQTLVRDLTETYMTKPGITACTRVRRRVEKMIHTRPEAKVALIRCPSKKDVQSMTQVDKAAT